MIGWDTNTKILNRVIKGINQHVASDRLGRSHRLPLQNIHARSSKSFEIIHVDIRGPSPIASVNGMIYFVFFVNNFSRYQWLYVMHNKSHATHNFQHFDALVARQFNESDG